MSPHLTVNHCQVSLDGKDSEETQVSQGQQEWKEPRDSQALLEHQGQGDSPDLRDQEQEKESQEYQEERVGLSVSSLLAV